MNFRRATRTGCLLAAAAALPPSMPAQQKPNDASPPVAATPAPAPDPRLAAAEELIGRALILRGFYAGAELQYDASGKLTGAPTPLDWTLAAVNVETVSQQPGELLLEGTRVAIRYNPDAHTFDRHPLKSGHLRIRLAQPETPAATAAALAAIFSTGIDPALQRSMPDLWRHYFEPGLDWGNDTLATAGILKGPLPANLLAPAAVKKLDPLYTPAARQDRVEGTVTLRVVVDTHGVARRIAVARPLGYGLDLQAADAVAHWTFAPAMRDGTPIPVEILLTLPFTLARTP